MTVRDRLRELANRLQSAGVESARVEAEWLLAQVLGMPRMHLFLEQSRELTEAEARSLAALVARREQREPLQHLLDTAEFCGRVFTVNRHVLIPRPETELLAQLAVAVGRASCRSPKPDGSPKRCGAEPTSKRFETPHAQRVGPEAQPAEAPAPDPFTRILDFGTGSGCLAVTLALELPGTEVHAVDLSPDALAVAQANANALCAEKRITFHLGDGFKALPAGLRFDLLVTNPPYIPSSEIATLQPEVRDFDPTLALDGGVDGLDFYRRLADEAPDCLIPGGQLLAEFGEGQGPDLKRIFGAAGWVIVAILPDDTGRERMLHTRRSVVAATD